ncbi:EF-P lysine aminoacylase EpmA [Roseiterribacter gracilis]|uniref:EF-P lysine aminoacylase GenX n=1 Tax=Roseiterribacter gracilis TaxID=2812848 RepID=A0A8S8XFI6_9PROT|nr:EF-P lysine aminoacylase GenX [Rhodospirillales bacterium TMPK1]
MVDVPSWRPDRFAQRRPYLIERARLTTELRAVFTTRGFVEVETPCLQAAPGLEPHLAGFSTELLGHDRQRARTLWLHTSPEFAMKKLLAAGMEQIWQLARCFRNGERSDLHHPEFAMLEWYRTGADWQAIVDDAQALLISLAPGGLRRADAIVDPKLPWDFVTFEQAFAAIGIDDVLSIDGDVDALAAKARAIGARVGDGDRFDDLALRILGERIEPTLGFDRVAVLHDYPVSMAALARKSPSDPRVAERFEIYVAGVELANGFGELTDAAEQRARAEADLALKQRLYGETWPLDEDFLAALEHGLPDCAGIALGFDRLVMLATGAKRIDDVLWSPVVEA